ncbi:MAG: Hsp20/alpha crystallin family protein [Ignavibacteria bacterium]|nr:Hsp20/alpha crystallin family protein [Ignavibacteria bacterium]
MFSRVQRYPINRSLFNLEREIDGLFGSVLGTGRSVWDREYPAVDIAEYENGSVIIAEMPGVKKEDVKISVQDGVLAISGERKVFTLAEGSRAIRNECCGGKFNRAVDLPHEVKSDAITAELTDGVLRIVLPKAEEARPKEIKIK